MKKMTVCWTYFISVFLILTQVLVIGAIDECQLSQFDCFTNGGQNCDKLDACRNNDRTFCNELASGWSCDCKPGYSGTGGACDDVDECKFQTQTNCESANGKNCGGISNCGTFPKSCINLVGSWQCNCSDGFEVDTTTDVNFLSLFKCIQIDECERGLYNCGTYAECIDRTPTDGDRSKYTCECPDSGFNRNSTGTICDDIDECKYYTAGTLCSRSSGCRNTIGSYVCACLPGYRQVGSQLSNATECVDINECDSNICSLYNHTVCKNTNGSYQCICNSSYYNAGSDDNPKCLAIEPCSSPAFNNCTAPQICTPIIGGFKCVCPSGYTTKSDGSCLDRDECSASISPLYPCERDTSIRKLMPNNATCINTLGSYSCACPTGYRLSPTNNCIGINYCTEGVNQCSSKSTCIYDGIPGQYRCMCKSNYLAGNELISKCVNKNECQYAEDNCDRVNGFCNDTDGSFTCGCNKGFEQDQNSIVPKCIDIDECFTGTACDTRYNYCKNTVGSFSCICKPGLEEIPNIFAHVCRDINECCPINKCFKNSDVTAICTNSHGSYDCECPDGYFGNGYALNVTFPINGTGCTDIDECKYQPCRENQQCINTPGSYLCHCKPGFYLKSGFPLCQDINECRTVNICGPARCVNTIGSYMCECPDDNVGININGVVQCLEYFSLPSEQKLKNGQLIANILVLKKVFTVSLKVKFTPSVGNIIKLVDNEGNVYIDVSLNDTKIVNYVFGSTITTSATLNQWFTILVTRYEFAGNYFISVYQNNSMVGNASFDGPSEYGNLKLLTTNSAANASISDLKVSNGITSIWSKWELQTRCQPYCGNGTATYVRTCNSPICSFLSETKTESCKILNCDEGYNVFKHGSCCGLPFFQNYEEFITFFDTLKIIDVQIVLQTLKNIVAVQLPFVCNGTFNDLAWNDINAAYNQSAEGLNGLLNLKNTLRAYIGCQPDVLKRPLEPSSRLITTMFEKYEEIVERYFAVSNLFVAIKNKYREIKQKVDMCNKQGLVDILYDSYKAKSMLEVSS